VEASNALMVHESNQHLRHALLRTALVSVAVAFPGCRSGGSDSTPVRGTTATTNGSTASTPETSSVFGVVLAGPKCPVETPDEPCPPRPVDAEIDAHDADGDVVASTRTHANGKYHLSLSPGEYTLVATGAGLPVCEPVTATVMTGGAVRADIGCDTGIR
jgi:hypothetical protein